MHHQMGMATRREATATNILVDVFEAWIEVPKQNSNNPTKKVTIDHISNAHGRLKAMANGSRPKIR